MDSSFFQTILFALLIGCFLVFVCCVGCIGACSDRGVCCTDRHHFEHMAKPTILERNQSVYAARVLRNGPHRPLFSDGDHADSPPTIEIGSGPPANICTGREARWGRLPTVDGSHLLWGSVSVYSLVLYPFERKWI